MKNISIVGLVVIVLGVLALAYQGINYTQRETIVDLGPLQATADHDKTLPIPPVLGAVAVAGGVALVVVGLRKRAA